MSQSTETSLAGLGGRDRDRAPFINRIVAFATLSIGLCRQRRDGWIGCEQNLLTPETFHNSWRQNRSRLGSCAVTYVEGVKVNSQIEVDLGLARVSEGTLAMLEGISRSTDLPQSLFSGLWMRLRPSICAASALGWAFPPC